MINGVLDGAHEVVLDSRVSPGERGDTRSGSNARASPVILPGTAFYNSEGNRRCDGQYTLKRAKAIDFLAANEVIVNGDAERLWRFDLNDAQRSTISPYNWGDYPIIAVSHGLVDDEYQKRLARFSPVVGTKEYLDYNLGQEVWVAVGVKLFYDGQRRIPTSDEEADMTKGNAPVWRAFYVIKKGLGEPVNYSWAAEILQFHRTLAARRFLDSQEAKKSRENPDNPDFIH